MSCAHHQGGLTGRASAGLLGKWVHKREAGQAPAIWPWVPATPLGTWLAIGVGTFASRGSR